MSTCWKGLKTDRKAMYREMQRIIPGLDALYGAVHASIIGHGSDAPHVLVVGAGGGREIEEFARCDAIGRVTAIDPSARDLNIARDVAGAFEAPPEMRFFVGTVDDLPAGETFDVATSLLVMHHLRDDGSKLAYLKSIRDRLTPGGLLIHADICFDHRDDLARLIPTYLAHARLVSASEDATQLELDAVPRLPVVSGARIRRLFVEANLAEPFEVFRALWYRCWISTRLS